MSIWKSPVFYIGVLLALLVTVALAAPFVVNWDSYRADLESYGTRLTGRQVTISGPIDARLFPWPRLEMSQVEIANAKGFGGAALFTTDKMTVHLALGGLFTGALHVEAVELERPHLNAVRLADGRVNWRVGPEAGFAKSGVLSRVDLDKIKVSRGSLYVEDKARGFSTSLNELSLDFSAQALAGPWRVNGKGLLAESPVGLALSTSPFVPGGPLKFGFRLTPEEPSLPTVMLEGTWSDKDFKGKLRANPQTGPQNGKTSSEGNFRPLVLEMDVEAFADRTVFDKIRITPADTQDSGTLIEGFARVTHEGAAAKAEVLLKSPRVNLDTLMGAQSLSVWRDGGFLAVANRVFAANPENLLTELSLDISTLTSGGETLNDVRLRGIVERQAIRIPEVTAKMPGRSELMFDGILFPSDGKAELGGKLKFSSGDLRAFSSWLFPAQRSLIEQHWTGSRGRLNLDAGVGWSLRRFSLQDAKYELDGQPGAGEISFRPLPMPELDVRIEAKSIDLDRLLPQGFVATGSQMPLDLLGQLPVLLSSGEAMQKRLTLSAGALTFNGVTAQDVAFDFLSGLSGFEIKAFDIGSVGGARLQGNGLVLMSDAGPSGEINVALDAENPTGFLTLIGLRPMGTVPAWQRVLGRTQADFNLAISPEKEGPVLKVSSEMTSGGLALKGVTQIQGLESVETALINADINLSSNDSAELAGLLGLETLRGLGAGELKVKLKGSRSGGFTANADLSAFGTMARFAGTVKQGETFGAPVGKVEVSSEDAAALTQALGLPITVAGKNAVKLAGSVSSADGATSISSLKGEAFGQVVEISAKIAADGTVSADATTGPLDLRDLLALAFLRWQGPEADLGLSFAEPEERPVLGALFLRPSELRTGIAAPLKETVVGLEFKPRSTEVVLKQPGADGASLGVIVAPKGASFAVNVSGRMPIDLSQVLRLANGTVTGQGRALLQGEVSAEGRSAAAALASAQGKGSYWIEGGVLSRLTAQGHAAAVTSAQTSDALAKSFERLEQGPGTAFGTRTGDIALVTGAATFSPLKVEIDGSQLTVAATYDLPGQVLTIDAAIALPARSELPPVVISYFGTPGALQKRSGTSALAAKLGYELLSKEMAALEKLQQEQQAAIAREEEQRRLDEERFAAYQEQRAELRARAREQRFHAAERERLATLRKTQLEAALKSGDAINKAELQRRARLKAGRVLIVNDGAVAP